MMNVCIGILAYNEAARIGYLIADLGRQSLFADETLAIEIMVIANGCTDETAAVANSALTAGTFQRQNIRAAVHNLDRAGKSNAWNELIHTFCPPSADFIFVLDADIRIPDERVLRITLDGLIANQSAIVAIDQPVKDIAIKPKKSIKERIILGCSGTTHDIRSAICGQFYCARFAVVKRIWMPIGLPVEDGFLRLMVATQNFTSDERFDCILFVGGAWHVFESRRNVRDFFWNHIRRAIGTQLNGILFGHLLKESQNKTKDVGLYIARMNETEPNWLKSLLNDEQKNFLLTLKYPLLRFRGVSAPTAKLKKAPLYLITVPFDLAVMLVANHFMRRGVGVGLW